MVAAHPRFLPGFRFLFLAKAMSAFLEKTELNKSSSYLWRNRPAFASVITEKRVIFESGNNKKETLNQALRQLVCL